MIKIKRVYESFDKNDGFRILVDRLWPRGLTKGKARIDLWLGDITPSDILRKWFAHDLAKWDEFKIDISKCLKIKRKLSEQLRRK